MSANGNAVFVAVGVNTSGAVPLLMTLIDPLFSSMSREQEICVLPVSANDLSCPSLSVTVSTSVAEAALLMFTSTL